MRYAVRRLRRKMPQAQILLGCWVEDLDVTAATALREAARADLVATTLRNAMALCLGMAKTEATEVAEGPLASSAA